MVVGGRGVYPPNRRAQRHCGRCHVLWLERLAPQEQHARHLRLRRGRPQRREGGRAARGLPRQRLPRRRLPRQRLPRQRRTHARGHCYFVRFVGTHRPPTLVWTGRAVPLSHSTMWTRTSVARHSDGGAHTDTVDCKALRPVAGAASFSLSRVRVINAMISGRFRLWNDFLRSREVGASRCADGGAWLEIEARSGSDIMP